jgi:hypothetical protein
MSEHRSAADERVGRLYSLPLEGFTSARNELAKALRKEGDRDGADAVKALKQPSIEAWTVNQLVREHGGEIDRLIALAEDQPDVLASGDRDRVRKSLDDLKGTLSSLTGHAERALRGSERKPTPALLERVTRLLQSSASSDEGRSALREGRFISEAEPGDLPDFDAAPPRERAREEQAARLREEAEVNRLERALRKADEHAQRLRERADEIQQSADEARQAADEATRAADDAKDALIARRDR